MIESKLPHVGTTIFTRMSSLANECGALNLSQGFPDFGAPKPLLDALVRRVSAGHNQYAPMAGVTELREQITAQLIRYRGVTCNPDTEVTVVPGATEAIFCAITACVHTGDEVLLFDPCYDSYEPAIALAGGRAVHLPLTPDNFAIDWQQVGDSITPRTRMIIVNSPHNPTGAILSWDDLLELERLAELHDLLVISDEVYEHLVFDGKNHHSVLQLPALRQRSFAVFSFGKTYSVTGWKTGYCIAPDELTAELRKVHQFVCFVANTPVQLALADFMAAEPDYPGTLADFYQAKRDLFCQALSSSRFNLAPSAGTYFQLLEYSAVSDKADQELASQWTREIGIASIPISAFYQNSSPGHYLRFCFAKNNDVLLEASDRLCKI